MQNILNEKLLSVIAKGEFIYPKDVSEKFGISLSEAYKQLENLKNDGLIVNCFRLYCSLCNKWGEVYPTISSMPEEDTCQGCKEKKNAIEDAIVIYRLK